MERAITKVQNTDLFPLFLVLSMSECLIHKMLVINTTMSSKLIIQRVLLEYKIFLEQFWGRLFHNQQTKNQYTTPLFSLELLYILRSNWIWDCSFFSTFICTMEKLEGKKGRDKCGFCRLNHAMCYIIN